MTPEEIKSMSDELAKNIDAKLADFSAKAETLTTEAKKEFNTELKKMIADYNKLAEDFKTLQGSVDSMAAESKRINLTPDEVKSFTTELNKKLQGEDFKKWVANRKEGAKTQFNAAFSDIELKTAITPSTHTAGTVQSQFDSTIRHEPDRRMHIRDIIPVAPTTSNNVTLVVEKTITDGTATTAIGIQKGVSQFTLDVENFPVQKIAAALKIPEEMLDDVVGLTAYITSRWGAKLSNKEDYELLYNTAAATEFGGITTLAQAYEDVLGDAAVSRWDVLRAAITQAIVDEYTPTRIVLHPTDVMLLRNEKDTTGQYIGMAAPWSPAPLMVDGVPIFTTTAIGVGEFLVGDFAMGAQIWDRKSPSIRFYDQDEDNAQKNLITVVVEERLTLSVNRANAFIYGTFAAALAKGSA